MSKVTKSTAATKPAVRSTTDDAKSGTADAGAAISAAPADASGAVKDATQQPDRVDPMTHDDERGKADAGAAKAAAPADAAHDSAEPSAESPPDGGKGQTKRTYVASWALRHGGKRYAEGAALPAFSEDETASLLKLGAIRITP